MCVRARACVCVMCYVCGHLIRGFDRERRKRESLAPAVYAGPTGPGGRVRCTAGRGADHVHAIRVGVAVEDSRDVLCCKRALRKPCVCPASSMFTLMCAMHGFDGGWVGVGVGGGSA